MKIFWLNGNVTIQPEDGQEVEVLSAMFRDSTPEVHSLLGSTNKFREDQSADSMTSNLSSESM
ncbi:MAG: hypothetical protein JWO13_3127 [Acidobacteriales bacterium]|nr:hypothetical protein [Terriglobales bacterium]